MQRDKKFLGLKLVWSNKINKGPTSCLPLMWKMVTSTVAVSMNEYLGKKGY